MNRYDRRFIAARNALSQHRNSGFGLTGEEAVVRQCGLSGMGEFWDLELSEPLECRAFAHSLAVHFFKIDDKPGLKDAERGRLGPKALQRMNAVEHDICRALIDARRYGESWLIDLPIQKQNIISAKSFREIQIKDTIDGPLKTVKALVLPLGQRADGIDLDRMLVRPREAAAWMLTKSRWRDLVPPSLVAAHRPDQKPATSKSDCKPAAPRPRGPKPTKQQAVASAMRSSLFNDEHTSSSLAEATEESLVAEFGTTRFTCREARKKVLSEFPLEITPTTDK